MYEIAFFAGGLGTRLKNTESLPKPFVDINGSSLISRIIQSFRETGIFSKFHILTCCDSNNYSTILKNELPNLDIHIYNEENRSGRSGALKYFLRMNTSINKFFVANGDTLFSNLSSSEILTGINIPNNDLPVAFLANPDSTRNDYLAIQNSNSKDSLNMQNSGLFYISRSWLESVVFSSTLLKDIDHYLFSLNSPAIAFPLSTNIYDAGTPERLSQIRELIK